MPREFVNPYNFIPLSENLKKRCDERLTSKDENGKLFTGKIHYSAETVTPLHIPNTSNDRIFGVKANHQDQKDYHKCYDFFSYNDLAGCNTGIEQLYYVPVIPGSEMRGAIRNIYEALTDSCLSAVDEDTVFSRRTPERYNAGLLVRDGKGKYVLKEAEDCICRDCGDFSVFYPGALGRYRDGTSVHYNESWLNNNRRPFAKKIVDITMDPSAPEGYIIKGQAGPVLPKPSRGAKCAQCPGKTQARCKKNNEKMCYLLMKHNAHVFVEAKKGNKGGWPKSWLISDQNIQTLDSVLEIYKKNDAGAYDEYRKTWKEFKDGQLNVVPVYYSVLQTADRGEEMIMLSPACITREVYHNTLKSVLGSHYFPCTDGAHLCPACQLFGTVNKGLSKASSVRFSDLRAEDIEDTRDYYGELLTLDELGQPKPSSMEFYLKKPKVSMRPGEKLIAWTFDYYITVDQDGKPGIYFYSPDIAGRKFYWHSSKAVEHQKTLREAIEKEKEWSVKNPNQDKYITKRNKTIRPVREGIKFYGEVYFDRITEKQLEQMIAILNISKSEKYGIKIGGAKPLGLGSIKLKVRQVDYREVSSDGGRLAYQIMHYDYKNADISGVCDSWLLKAFEFDAVDENRYDVAYPFVNGTEDDGFTWFGANRKAFSYKKVQGYNGKMKMDYSRLDVERSDPGPGARIQVPYMEYMEALRPKLVDNGFPKASGTGWNTNSNGNTGYKTSTDFVKGKEYEGKVFGYNASGRFAKVRLDDGGRASFYDGNHGYEDRRVKLCYAGKDDSGHDRWTLLE